MLMVSHMSMVGGKHMMALMDSNTCTHIIKTCLHAMVREVHTLSVLAVQNKLELIKGT